MPDETIDDTPTPPPDAVDGVEKARMAVGADRARHYRPGVFLFEFAGDDARERAEAGFAVAVELGGFVSGFAADPSIDGYRFRYAIDHNHPNHKEA